MKKCYVFWKYDLFPYLVGSTAVRIGKNKYEVWGSHGVVENPKFVLTAERGMDLNHQLDNLKIEYDKTKDVLRQVFIIRRDNLLAELEKSK